MKILYYGGQKSGKSLLAEQKALELSDGIKPCYIATYDNSFNDDEMRTRIKTHQKQREDRFITIEEPLHPSSHIQAGGTYLIDCMSMWLLNTLEMPMEMLIQEIEALCATDADIVFVLNDVSSGIIPIDAMSRTYVDRSGIVGQKLAALCDEVYEVKLGIAVRLK